MSFHTITPDPLLSTSCADLLLAPRGFRKKTGQVGLVGPIKHTSRNVGETLVLEYDQPCQIVLKMRKLTTMVRAT